MVKTQYRSQLHDHAIFISISWFHSYNTYLNSLYGIAIAFFFKENTCQQIEQDLLSENFLFKHNQTEIPKVLDSGNNIA